MSPLNWKGDEAIKATREAAAKAHWEFAEALLTNTIQRTPKDEGTLRNSGTVTQADLPSAQEVFKRAESGEEMNNAFAIDENGDLVFFVSFNTPYAIKLHEAEPGEYNFREPGAEVKFLEKTGREMSNKMEKYTGERIRELLR
ncbi:MAG: hypothetical protein ACLFN4_06660 [Candidatus Acetothermia bacterium]